MISIQQPKVISILNSVIINYNNNIFQYRVRAHIKIVIFIIIYTLSLINFFQSQINYSFQFEFQTIFSAKQCYKNLSSKNHS